MSPVGAECSVVNENLCCERVPINDAHALVPRARIHSFMASRKRKGAGDADRMPTSIEEAREMSDQLLRDTDTILATPADEVRLIEGKLQQINRTIDKAREGLNSPAHASRSGPDDARKRYNAIVEEQIAARDVENARLDEAKAGAEPASTRLMRKVSLIQAFVDRYDVDDKPKEDIHLLQMTQGALLRISLRAQPMEAQVDRILHLSAFMSKFLHKARDRVQHYVALKGFAPLRELFHEILSTRHSDPTVIGQSVIVAEKVYKINAYAMQLGLECDEAWRAEVGTGLIEPIHLACMISRVAKDPLLEWSLGPSKFMSHFGDCILQALTGASPDLQIAACNRLLQNEEGYRPTRRLLNVLEFLFRQYRMLPRVRVIDGSEVAGDESAAFSLGTINEELHKLSHAHIAVMEDGPSEYGWNLYHSYALGDECKRNDDELPVLGPKQIAFLNEAALKESIAPAVPRSSIQTTSKRVFEMVRTYMDSGGDAEREHGGEHDGVFYGAPLFLAGQLAYVSHEELKQLLRIYAYSCMHFALGGVSERDVAAPVLRRFTERLYHIIRRLPFHYVPVNSTNHGFDLHAVLMYMQTDHPGKDSDDGFVSEILSKVMTFQSIKELDKRQSPRAGFADCPPLDYARVLRTFTIGMRPARMIEVHGLPALLAAEPRNHPAGLMTYETAMNLKPFNKSGKNCDLSAFYEFFLHCSQNWKHVAERVKPGVVLGIAIQLLRELIYAQDRPQEYSQQKLLEGLHNFIPDPYWAEVPVCKQRMHLTAWFAIASAIDFWRVDKITDQPIRSIITGPLDVGSFLGCLHTCFTEVAARPQVRSDHLESFDSNEWDKVDSTARRAASNLILMALRMKERTDELTYVISGAVSQMLKSYGTADDARHGKLPASCVVACNLLVEERKLRLDVTQKIHICAAPETHTAMMMSVAQRHAALPAELQYFEGPNPFTGAYSKVWSDHIVFLRELRAKKDAGGGGAAAGDGV